MAAHQAIGLYVLETFKLGKTVFYAATEGYVHVSGKNILHAFRNVRLKLTRT